MIRKSSERGEIATILTLGTLIVLGISTLVAPLFVNKKKTTNTRAAECVAGETKTECMNPKERQTCAEDAGVERVFFCEGGSWVFKYPQCEKRCAPGASSGVADPKCTGQPPGTIINNEVRKDCDTNIHKKVKVQQYCDDQGKIQEKAGEATNESCDISPGSSCNKGAVYDSCFRQDCDTSINYYVCIDKYWDNSCQLKDRPSARTNTPCNKAGSITSEPTIVYPSITPGGGSGGVVFKNPTPTPTSRSGSGGAGTGGGAGAAGVAGAGGGGVSPAISVSSASARSSKLLDGWSCNVDDDCQGGNCTGGICMPKSSATTVSKTSSTGKKSCVIPRSGPPYDNVTIIDGGKACVDNELYMCFDGTSQSAECLKNNKICGNDTSGKLTCIPNLADKPKDITSVSSPATPTTSSKVQPQVSEGCGQGQIKYKEYGCQVCQVASCQGLPSVAGSKVSIPGSGPGLEFYFSDTECKKEIGNQLSSFNQWCNTQDTEKTVTINVTFFPKYLPIFADNNIKNDYFDSYDQKKDIDKIYSSLDINENGTGWQYKDSSYIISSEELKIGNMIIMPFTFKTKLNNTKFRAWLFNVPVRYRMKSVSKPEDYGKYEFDFGTLPSKEVIITNPNEVADLWIKF